uniref:Transcriptional activator protein Pur-alpha n=1 Tax=Macrostomum lignano TaxID=282301 RepID=A0A1I8JQD2_9PLAT
MLEKEIASRNVQTDSGATDGGDQHAFKFRSETIVRENRRYFLDLKENQRGKFLRIAQQGLEDMRDRLVELMEECGTDDMAEGVERLPAPKSLRVDNKMFYFDVGANRRGMFLRLSEVRANFRTAVTVPEKSWASVRDILDEYIGKMAEENKEGAKEADEKEQ